MDEVYYAISEPLDIAKFLSDYQERLKPITDSGSPGGGLNDFFGSHATQSNPELESYIDLEMLSHPEDARVTPADLTQVTRQQRHMSSLSVPKKALNLKCVAGRIEAWSKKRTPEGLTKYRSARYVAPKSASEKTSAADTELVEPFSDVLITIRLFIPFKYNPYSRCRTKLDREIVVLGSQYLHELRDSICCSCDTIGPFTDVSKNPDADVRGADKYADKTNSGYLFIGDTFYNDMRKDGNTNYSQVVIDWAKQQPEIKELKQAKMEDTKFVDLKRVRIGFPYMYQHFGECEHIFLISDVQIISPSDNRVRSDYPYLRLLKSPRTIVCDICGIYEASNLVRGSQEHIFDPVRLCAKCLSSYHYLDGKKLGEFSCYRSRK